MKHLQIAILDRSYAEKLRDLLATHGKFSVYLVDHPRPDVPGVVVADEGLMDRLLQSGEGDLSRYVIFLTQPDLDWNRLFDAGVRYVIHADTPPVIGHLTVLAAESRLNPKIQLSNSAAVLE